MKPACQWGWLFTREFVLDGSNWNRERILIALFMIGLSSANHFLRYSEWSLEQHGTSALRTTCPTKQRSFYWSDDELTCIVFTYTPLLKYQICLTTITQSYHSPEWWPPSCRSSEAITENTRHWQFPPAYQISATESWSQSLAESVRARRGPWVYQ